ncbi:MAG TPA: hypothetical protein PLF40_01250 [Kofleriaceae bacterium]|nr:hypothetical protein [Kofleriaceae bacterium]
MELTRIVCAAMFLSIAACNQTDPPASVDAPAVVVDAAAAVVDSAPCTPGAASLKCVDSKTVSLCTTDTDFDGQADSAATTVQLTCKKFFRNAGEASCENFSATDTEALCTMDDGGPCGVFVLSGQATVARCTTDDAVCMLDLSIRNYRCKTATGITCEQTGAAFVPFCRGNLLIEQCNSDGDGKHQPFVDDCAALGGVCDATLHKCAQIRAGGECRDPDWLCAPGLTCVNRKCQ